MGVSRPPAEASVPDPPVKALAESPVLRARGRSAIALAASLVLSLGPVDSLLLEGPWSRAGLHAELSALALAAPPDLTVAEDLETREALRPPQGRRGFKPFGLQPSGRAKEGEPRRAEEEDEAPEERQGGPGEEPIRPWVGLLAQLRLERRVALSLGTALA